MRAQYVRHKVSVGTHECIVGPCFHSEVGAQEGAPTSELKQGAGGAHPLGCWNRFGVKAK
jgi:hypothetical protein